MPFDPDAYLQQSAPAQQPQQTPAFDPDAYLKAGNPDPVVYSGSILPVSKTASGERFFDPLNAGPIGAFKRAFTLPGRVYSGETPFIAGDPKSTGEALNLAGTFGSGVNPMVRSGDRAIPGVRMAEKDPSLARVPTDTEHLATGRRQLDAFQNMPIRYNPEAINALGSRIEQDILKVGALPENTPQLYAFINALKRTAPASNDPTATISAGPANLMAMRTNLTKLFKYGGERHDAIYTALQHLDDFIEKPAKGTFLAGSDPWLSIYGPQLYAEGRANFGAGKRGAGLEDIKRTADFRAASANSGANTDNSLRSRVTSLILNARKTRGFTDEEKAALEAVPLGTAWNNLKRNLGSALGGGGGPVATVPASVAAGAANYLGVPEGIAAGIGAATPVVGRALRNSAGESTREALDRAIDMTRRRSPLFQQMGRQDLVHDTNAQRDALARTLMRVMTEPQGVPTPQLPVLEYDPNRV